MQANTMPFSAFGVPLLGLAGLTICLWHPQMSLRVQAPDQNAVYLVTPSPKLDPSMTVFLRQEARNVAYSRLHDDFAVQTAKVSNYNLIARECTPAVFEATHLPPLLTP